MPALNVPPAPVMMPSEMSSRDSISSTACAMPSVTARSMALRAAGRSIVITAIRPANSACTTSDMGSSSTRWGPRLSVLSVVAGPFGQPPLTSWM